MTGEGGSASLSSRHGRARPGHPRFDGRCEDGRDEPGHDGQFECRHRSCGYRSSHAGFSLIIRFTFHSLGQRLMLVSRWIATTMSSWRSK